MGIYKELDTFFLKIFLLYFRSFIQNETLIQVIKITQYIQINI